MIPPTTNPSPIGPSGFARLACLLVATLAAASCLLSPPVDPVHATPVAEEKPGLAAALEAAFAATAPLGVDATPVDMDALRTFYEERGFAPLWVGGAGAVDERGRAVAAVLADAGSEGLDPRHYHAGAIARLLDASAAQELVRLELMISDGVLRYSEHQARGVSPPGPGHREMASDRPDVDPRETLLAIANAPDPAAHLRALAPASPEYRRLRDALGLYRKVEKEGGWPTIPDGPTLRVGASDARVAIVRRRLALDGDNGAGATRSTKYDTALAAAVRRFQERNGIGADGSLGATTRTALNVPVRHRIEQITVNMERWRWIGPGLGERYVKVNVPAFTLEMVHGGETMLSMPVVVGKPTWRTPLFSSEIRHVVFNPSWFVPPKIARDEILPKARADATYLSREGYVVRRVSLPPPPTANGDLGESEVPRPVAREILRLRQPPGPKNPLGRVKFEMPNPFGVYLHDTPSRRAFSRPSRALSHGCVRLGKALTLADALMMQVEGWSEQRRDRILAGWKTRTIALPNPVPVHVLYETAWSDASGALHFRADLYGRDDDLKRQMAESRLVRPSSIARQQADPAQPPIALP